MPRQRIGAEPMSPAERQARHRAKLREQHQALPIPAALARPKGAGGQRPTRTLSRPQRWAAAVATLTAVQEEYQGWLDNLPANLEGSRLADKLQAICELDLEELQTIDPPRGYGRD
jgi:hypothetical protein